MKKILIALFLLLISPSIIAQQNYDKNDVPIPYGPQPEVGKPMPDFYLDHITHYKSTKASLNDFKGKWLFLDFWFPGCVTCIESFPKVNEFQKQFKDKIQYLLVGLNGKDFKGIEEVYQKIKNKKSLELASSFDSVLSRKWGIRSMPHIYIINPEGTLKFITDGRDMSIAKLQDLIDGKDVTFYAKDVERPKFDASNKLAKNGKVFYQSLLASWSGQSQVAGHGDFGIKDELTYLTTPEGMSFSMATLEWLYKWAYMGYSYWTVSNDSLHKKYYPKLVLEVRDKTPFEADFRDGKNTYNYSLVLPESLVSIEHVMQIMQQDLKKSFGYETSLEIRKMPVWKLVAKPGAVKALKAKGGDKIFTSVDSSNSIALGFIMKNYPIDEFFRMITLYISDGRPPFFNETGITGNIDITIDATISDLEDIKKALQKNGLDLVMGTKMMKVLVIRDQKPIKN